MDAVDDTRIARLQSIVSHTVRGFLDEQVSMLFFDVTTLYFASDKPDALRQKGFNKDGKPQKVQLVLALFQTVEGLPIGYELFPGNTADVRTLKPALEALKERFRIGNVILVADAGMLSRQNLDLLASEGWDWVVAARLRSLSRTMEAMLFKPHNWIMVSEDTRIAELALQGQRLVIRHSESRARKNALEREKTVAKLQQRLTQGIKGNGKAGRFLSVDRGAVTLDHDAIERDARYDGLHGVWTSLDRKRYAAQDIYAYYGQLWRIEDGFRVLKHTMMTRPIYHWTPRRVRGAHGDLLRRLCVVTPVALPIQLHACRPGAAQRSAHPGRAHRRSNLPPRGHQHAETILGGFPCHQSAACTLPCCRPDLSQQNPRADRCRSTALSDPGSDLKGHHQGNHRCPGRRTFSVQFYPIRHDYH